MRKTNIQEANRQPTQSILYTAFTHSMCYILRRFIRTVQYSMLTVNVSILTAISLVWVRFFFARSSLIIWLHPTKRKYNTSRTKKEVCSSFRWGFVGFQCEGLDERESSTKRQPRREREKEIENRKIWKLFENKTIFWPKNQEGGYAVDVLYVRITLLLSN